MRCWNLLNMPLRLLSGKDDVLNLKGVKYCYMMVTINSRRYGTIFLQRYKYYPYHIIGIDKR